MTVLRLYRLMIVLNCSVLCCGCNSSVDLDGDDKDGRPVLAAEFQAISDEFFRKLGSAFPMECDVLGGSGSLSLSSPERVETVLSDDYAIAVFRVSADGRYPDLPYVHGTIEFAAHFKKTGGLWRYAFVLRRFSDVDFGERDKKAAVLAAAEWVNYLSQQEVERSTVFESVANESAQATRQ